MSKDKKKLFFLIFVWILAFIIVAWSYQTEAQENDLTKIELTETQENDLTEIELIKKYNPITYYFNDDLEILPYPILKGVSLSGNPHYGESSKCLGQFRDNFFNTSYVSASENLVFNTTLGFVELDQYNSSTQNDVMQLWTGVSGGFTEYDAGGDNLKIINSTAPYFDDVDRDEGDRLLKDFTNNYFDSYFHYFFRVKIASSHTNNARCYFMAFVEDTQSIYNTILSGKNYVGFHIQYKTVGSTWELRLRSYNGSSVSIDAITEAQGLDMDKVYHVEYIRNGNNVSAWYYNDKDRTDLDFMLTIDTRNVDNLRYFHPLNAENQATGGRAMDLWLSWVRNATIGLIYRENGYFITTDYLLSPNANGICLNLMTNATQGNFTSMSVQFSPDNVTWYNNQNVSGYNNIINGFQSTDMRNLNFTSKALFKYNFTRGSNPFYSPELWQSRLLTSIGVPGIGTTDRFVIGLSIGIALLIIAVLFYERR